MERILPLQLVIIALQSLLPSFLQVVLGGEAQCRPDQYVDRISPQFCKNCVDVCDRRREPLLENCKSVCPAYYALKFKTPTSPSPVITPESTIWADTSSSTNTLGLVLIVGSGVAFVFIVSCALVLIRRHKRKKKTAKEAEHTDQETPLKYPTQEIGQPDVLVEVDVVSVV